MSNQETRPEEIPETTLDDLIGCAGYQGPSRSLEEMEAGVSEGAQSAAGGLTREIVLRRLRESYPQLREQYGIRKISLFGSFARGTAGEASDVDLIVEFQRPIGLRFVELVEYLEELLERKVDVLTPAGLRGIRPPHVVRQIEEKIIEV